MSPWRVLEHTADVGLVATGETLEAALADLLVGYGKLVCPEGKIRAGEEAVLTVEGERLDDLVVDLLDELNFLHQMEGFLPAEARVERTGGGLTARMKGEAWDEEVHGYLMEIKATTFHDLVVDEASGDQPARVEVIFDI